MAKSKSVPLNFENNSYSISRQLSDIGLHRQMSNLKAVHIPINMFVCTKSATRKALGIREKLCPWLSLLMNIVVL